MKVADICQAVKPLQCQADLDTVVRGVCTDSRDIVPGNLFVALRGTAVDANKFLLQAADEGAVAALTDTPPAWAPLPLIVVDDAREALGRLCLHLYPQAAARLRHIGVTGTNGKTTTTMLIQHLLNQAQMRCGLIGTIQRDLGHMVLPGDMTTPAPLDLTRDLAHMAGAGCRYSAMEVSSHALDQQRVAHLPFSVAVFTNLTQDHLDYHGSMDAYADAKARLFASLAPDATAVINADDPGADRMVRDCRATVIRYGFAEDAQLQATDLRLGLDGTTFLLRSPYGEAAVRVPLPGRFNVSNALAALAVAVTQGVPLSQAVRALGEFPGVPGRLETVACDRGFQVLVDYAHTDDALVNVLETLRELKPRRLITLFGCGGDRDRGKRPKMARAACRYSDVVIVTNDNPRTEDPERIMADIRPGLDGAVRTWEVLDRAEAIRLAVKLARPGDAVLLAGKGHEDYQIVGTRKLRFDDRVVAAEAIRSLRAAG